MYRVCGIFLFPAVPSAPQNVISIVNETSLKLQWNPPQESGGRNDVVYNIICKSCGSGRGGCTRCGDNVQFVPRQLGLTDTGVHISDLLAHTQYTFEIQAVNGVSDQSPYSPQYVSVNITTNQAGETNPTFYIMVAHWCDVGPRSSSLIFSSLFVRTFSNCWFLCLFCSQHHQQWPLSTRWAEAPLASLCPGPSRINPMVSSWTMNCGTMRRYVIPADEELATHQKDKLSLSHDDMQVVPTGEVLSS